MATNLSQHDAFGPGVSAPGCAREITAASVRADFVLVQMFASVATGSATPAAADECRAQRFFRM